MLNTASRLAFVVALGLPGVVHAQQEPNRTVVEDVVVTAQRREERLQDVPLSVSAASGESLEQSGITEAVQLTQVMPGLTFSRNSVQFQPYIRGVGTRAGADESNVAVYLDGVYQPIMGTLGLDLLNVERVEVLRGPQGTLFGRNATGGLINVITTDPDTEFGGRVVLRAGNFGETSGQLYLTGPITNGLSGSISYLMARDDGYIRDLLRGGHTADRDAEIVRANLLFEPFDNFRATFAASTAYVVDPITTTTQPVNGNTQANLLTPRPLYGTEPWESAAEDPIGYSFLTSFDLQTQTSFPGFDLETTSSLQNGGAANRTDNDGSSAPMAGSRSKQPQRWFSNEVRLLSTTEGPLSWIAGVYLIDGHVELDPLQPYTNGVYAAPFNTVQNIESWAVFGEASYMFGDHLRLTTGLRYTEEERDYRVTRETNPTTVPVPLQEGSDNNISYRASLQYIFNDDANVYVTVSRGYKSGVYNQFGTSLATSVITRPEILDSYEVGLKADPLPWLRTNLSVFHYDYQDIQQTARDPATNLTLLFNAAQSEMNGFEAEIAARASEDLSLRAFVTYLDAQYTEFPTAAVFTPRLTLPSGGVPPGGTAAQYCPVGVVAPCGNVAVAPYDASGKDMVRAPEWTVGFSFDYSRPTNIGVFGIAGNAFWSAESYWDFENRLAEPSYVQLNGEVSWRTSQADDALRISIWGRNLANEAIHNQVLTSGFGDVAAFDRPRSYGISISRGF